MGIYHQESVLRRLGSGQFTSPTVANASQFHSKLFLLTYFNQIDIRASSGSSNYRIAACVLQLTDIR
jgi:hypothetical protein